MATELPPDLKARILQAAEQTPSPARKGDATLSWFLMGGALAASLLVFAVEGGVRATGRPPELMLGTLLGTAGVAAAGIWALATRGGSMVGRSRGWLLGVSFTAPALLFAWKVFWSSRFLGALAPWPTRPGFRCFALSIAVGLLPLVGVFIARRGTDPTHPKTAGFALGLAMGLGAAGGVDLWCPVAYAPHLLLGHLLPMLVLALLGSVIGGWILAPGGR